MDEAPREAPPQAVEVHDGDDLSRTKNGETVHPVYLSRGEVLCRQNAHPADAAYRRSYENLRNPGEAPCLSNGHIRRLG